MGKGEDQLTCEDRLAEIRFGAETGDPIEGLKFGFQNTQFRQFLRSMFRIRLSYRALYYQAQIQSGVLTVRTDRAKLPETDRPQSDRASSFRAKPSPCLGTRERTQNLFILP
jgi:hypothetical protein